MTRTRQVVDGFAFGLHTLGSSMSGEQQAFNELPCFIAMHDRFMEVLAVNDLYRERLGNLVGHPSWEPYVLHSNEAMFPVERAIVEGRGARSEQILRDKNGKEIPVLVHTAPILNNEGEVELVLELSVDEQESRRLREELRVTRERFRQLFEESPCYVSVVGRDLQVLEANRAFRHTFGMQSGKRCYELFAAGNGVHAFGGELVQRREDRGGIVQTPHAVIQISQNGQSVALFLRKRHLNPLSSGPCRR